jgi:hypothetical protein
MALGPIELVAVKFPGNQFKGEIIPAIQDLVDREIIRVIDVLLVVKDSEGNIASIEAADLPGDRQSELSGVVDDVSGLLGDDDVAAIADQLEPNSSAGLLVFEDIWAVRLRDALKNADAELLMLERIPGAAVEEALAASATA